MPLDLKSIRSRLPGRRICWFDTIGSTMDEARSLARDGCPEGTVVVAEQQFAGHGRYGRTWHSPHEAGLYFSVVLRPPLTPENMPALTLAAGLATAEAIERASGVGCDLRWPNDVLIGERKCAGILIEYEASASAFVVGIGINVNHTEFPNHIAHLATSLLLTTGRFQNREPLFVSLIELLDIYTETLEARGRERILRLFADKSSYVRGRQVVVEQVETRIEGVTDGLDSYGFLVLRRPDGQRDLILTGGVRPAD